MLLGFAANMIVIVRATPKNEVMDARNPATARSRATHIRYQPCHEDHLLQSTFIVLMSNEDTTRQ